MKRSKFKVSTWDDFHKSLEDLTNVCPSNRRKSIESDRRVLETLALLFWTWLRTAEPEMGRHWTERRRSAIVLLNGMPKMIRAANKLILKQACIEAPFVAEGTGRHSRKDIGVESDDDILDFYNLVELLNKIELTLKKLTGKRKPSIADDRNLFLYLMTAYWRSQADIDLDEREHVSAAAIHREIWTLVEAWRLSLDIKHPTLDEKEITRRIGRFRIRNQTVASSIDSNPYEFILYFLAPSSRQPFVERGTSEIH
jgi:hypothetical protein